MKMNIMANIITRHNKKITNSYNETNGIKHAIAETKTTVH